MAENTVIESALRRSPAEHLAGLMADAEVAGDRAVALREVAFGTQLGVRAIPGSAAHAALAQATGVGLPAAVGEVAGSVDGTAVLWLGPDEFLVATDAQNDLQAQLDAALGDQPGQVLDLSANRAVLELSGPAATLVLRKSCPADLHPRAFGVNQAIVTSLANIPVLLWRTGEESWRILPRISFTEHTVLWLVDAMTEFASEQVG
ncbi:sarcosine oxidase subunit gamma [Glutamicibacter uratoxydans]|uniref:Sarcosine oxidase subunit gamma n=1 Tax=Glutamicibacter uratoxydans TaxID=43667 RepID=A0A4Y4DIT0_GLUUR|nr:sarcosine oxidase subunit gamma family protein [Glutamicibacter uratoxydans]GED05162.1 sarcosine oxidase subunit gamma [Glutamicibacter uratoxydans]